MPPCRLYVHNGGKFDFFFLLKHLRHGKLKLINGRIMQMRIGNAILVDSYPLLPFALSAYKKDEIDYAKFERHCREDHKREIVDYLIADCVYLDELVQNFKQIVGNHATIGGAAMSAMKKYGYPIWHGNESHDIRFRPFYFGGRVQAFEKGIFTGHFDYVDINAAYPYAMTFPHAHGSEYTVSNSYDGSPQSFVRGTFISKGCLPLRDLDGTLLFPVDKVPREYLATGHEIVAGLETSTLKIVKVHDCFAPKRVLEFGGIVNEQRGRRLEAKRAGSLIEELAYKCLSNSSYGKFAQNPALFKDWWIEPRGEPKRGWKHETDFLNLTLWSKKAEVSEKSYFDVATAASITGLVRAHLWKACKNHAIRPIYCDTDSLICGKFRAKTSETELGGWKMEMRPTKLAIAGKKLYGASDGKKEKLATKGVRLTFSEIESIIKKDKVLWKKASPAYSLKSGARWIKREIAI